jgi:hypothetical protein
MTTSPAARRRLAHAALLALLAVLLFFWGRSLTRHNIDFVVYHKAAVSLLEGRTDLYSETFALRPPMRYVYPPLFVVLVAPLGLLSLSDAFGLWFALLILSSLAVVTLALRAWRPRPAWPYLLAALLLAGPWLIYGVRSANVHVLVVLLVLAAAVRWGEGRAGRAALLLAAGGALKLFPLYLVPVLAIVREWRLGLRVLGLSAALWAVPFAVFGPPRAAELYLQWWQDVGGNVDRLRLESRLDVSLESAAVRWLSPVDYSLRIDRAYPQVHLLDLGPTRARLVGRGLTLLVALVSLVALVRLGRSMADTTARAAAATSLCATAQLVVGPYTTLLYLSGWLIPALALPVAAAIQRPIHARLRAALLTLGVVNLVLVLAPGSARHRALEAWGAQTLISLALWGLSVWIAGRFPRRR